MSEPKGLCRRMFCPSKLSNSKLRPDRLIFDFADQFYLRKKISKTRRIWFLNFIILLVFQSNWALAFTSNVYPKCNESDQICYYTDERDSPLNYGIFAVYNERAYSFYLSIGGDFRGQRVINYFVRKEKTFSIAIDGSGRVGVNMNPGQYFTDDTDIQSTFPELSRAWSTFSDSTKTQVQKNLFRLELYKGPIDKILGAGTYSAIIGYNALFNQDPTISGDSRASDLIVQIAGHNRFSYMNGLLTVVDRFDEVEAAAAAAAAAEAAAEAEAASGDNCVFYTEESSIASCSAASVCRNAAGGNPIQWRLSEQGLIWVAEARRRNLQCGVACSPNSEHIYLCSDRIVCENAVTGSPSQWQIYGDGKIWSTEAQKRNLSCGVVVDAHQDSVNTCSNDPTKCGAVELCMRGSELQSGARVWRTDTNGKKYADAARSIGLSCNVSSELKDEVFRVANGTGFFVTSEGHVVTNQHVIDGCNEIQVHSEGAMTPATVVSQDSVNDLALLMTSQVPKEVFLLAENNPQLLDDIIAAGFPFGESVSSSVKVTKGIVSSLSGLGDNSGQIQIDAALQPGNSGGPIVNLQGNIVGVAVAKLDVEKSIENFGAIPENVNFGIKLSSLKTFLDDNNVNYDIGSNRGMQNAELGRQISRATVLLSCWMNEARIQVMTNERALFSAQNN